jgi:hypothetical protein
MPNPAWAIVATKLEGALFEGSNDLTSWTPITNIDTRNVHSGWNTWINPTVSALYRYIRFSHTSLSGCKMADI